MILADKIMNERKKNGWSQEELAEQLSVSRQSISKWEGAQAIPDIQKIIKMAELFGVTTDYLLRDDMEPESISSSFDASSDASAEAVVRVSLEEANEFLELTEEVAPKMASMVSLCIFAPALLLFFLALSQIPGFPLSEGLMAGFGMISLLILIAIAVFVFILLGAKMKRFEYLETSPIETLYGVTGMVKERKKSTEQTNVILTALGVILCIISPIPLLIVSFLEAPGYLILFMVSTLLLFVSVGVNLLVRSGSMNGAYDKLLQEGDYTLSQKKKSPVTGAVSTAYWTLIVAIFLAWSFITNDWGRSWIIWPVAGVLFGGIITISSAFSKGKQN